MAIRKTIGGDRLGSGNKMTTRLKNYERSTHDLGKVVRTSQATGTLVPIYCEPVLKGDVWEKDISCLIRTLPANGPIFGTWKLQVDVFTGDMRLYNKQLHNNLTGVGMNMKDIIFPRMRLRAKNPSAEIGEMNQQQISQSSLLAYLGVRGLGTLENPDGYGYVEIQRNAMPLMMYWDIYKEYYANKQEERGVVIAPQAATISSTITLAYELRENGGITNLELGTPGEAITLTTGADLIVEGKGLNINNISVYTYTEEVIPITQLPYESYEQIGYERIEFKNLTTTIRLRYAESTNEHAGKAIWLTDENAPTIGEELTLAFFPLSNIDDMREAVFAQPKTSPLMIGYEGEEDRGLPYRATTGISILEEIGEINNSYMTMGGLGVKTYQSDRFNNWLSTEWIDQVNSISAVDTSSGSFTMDALNLAQKVYELMNRVAVSGGTYQDWLEAVYGEHVHGAPEMPVYRGGMSAEITFDEVISSSDAQTNMGIDQPLGTLGGRGIQKMMKGGKIRFKAEEHGYVMVIASLTPRIDYSQGNKWWTKLETMDDLHKPQLDGIGFQELLTDEMAAWDTKVDAEGNETFFSAGKQPAWIQYMTNQNEVYGNFANLNSEMFMVLARRYQNDENGRIEDLTTYIDPSKFNYAFAYTTLESMPFWAQYGFDDEARRKMSACIIPNM